MEWTNTSRAATSEIPIGILYLNSVFEVLTMLVSVVVIIGNNYHHVGNNLYKTISENI